MCIELHPKNCVCIELIVLVNDESLFLIKNWTSLFRI